MSLENTCCRRQGSEEVSLMSRKACPDSDYVLPVKTTITQSSGPMEYSRSTNLPIEVFADLLSTSDDPTLMSSYKVISRLHDNEHKPVEWGGPPRIKWWRPVTKIYDLRFCDLREEIKLVERMACILRDFEAHQLEVDEQLGVVEEQEEDWDPQDELMDVER
ncbi:unnamed protein product [Heligmosomoides polygyrus]|uniref:Uncharacterized protein n=1 Tax=Heligmosomoides polygyrus TaxID=6339 RepID=A0A183G7W6_HELPZ|nr:unnamed protein product [Heligmosomoides polygyrus]